jgi:hypothetical protein
MLKLTRRYPLPTCTLVITALRSPLSRWQKRPVVKDLQFELQLDDPRNPEPEPIKIWGNAPQLEQICTVVQTYVQDTLLASAPQQLSLETTAIAMPGADLTLTPHSLLHHQFYVGHETVRSSQPVVDLNVTQLSDLVTVLETFQGELQQLPILPSDDALLPPWAKTAAAVAVGAIALTTATLYFNASQTPDTIISSEPVAPELAPSNADRDVLPPAPDPAPSPLATPTLPDELESLTTVRPPTGVDRPNPPAPPSAIAPSRPNNSAPAPRSEAAPSSASTTTSSSEARRSPSTAPSIPPVPSTPPRLPPNLPPLGASPAPSIASEPTQGNRPATDRNATDRNATDRPAPASPNADATALPFNDIPQVGEVRAYFQSRWQPPNSLRQALEYRLRLNPDGSIQRLIPLGPTSVEYLNRTPMPRLGEAFVSPLQGVKSAEIRLILDQSGDVQTFLENLE